MRSLRSIVVTGAAGSVGSAVARQLLSLDEVESVVALDILPAEAGARALAPQSSDPRFRYYQADAGDEGMLNTLIKEVQATGLFNLAEKRAGDSILETNVIAPATLLRVCRLIGVPFLQASTDVVYGDVPSPARATEEWPLQAGTTFAASKASAELLCFAATREYGQDVVVTRGAPTYGPRLPSDHRLTAFIRAAVREEPLVLPGDGMQIRNWLHLDDHCSGIIEAFRRAKSGDAYNLNGNCERTILGIARSIVSVLNKPESLIRPGQQFVPLAPRCATDGSRMTSYTGWCPRREFKSSFAPVIREAAANLAPSADPTR